MPAPAIIIQNGRLSGLGATNLDRYAGVGERQQKLGPLYNQNVMRDPTVLANFPKDAVVQNDAPSNTVAIVGGVAVVGAIALLVYWMA